MMSFRICGTLTTALAPTMAIPRAFEIAREVQAGSSTKLRSRRRAAWHGAVINEMIASWTGYKKGGPLLFSTEHKGTADGKPLHISITGVSVKVSGSDTWMDAK